MTQRTTDPNDELVVFGTHSQLVPDSNLEQEKQILYTRPRSVRRVREIRT